MRRDSIRTLRSSLARFTKAEQGTIAVITGLLLPTLIGMTALVAEFGSGLLVKSENQRIADLSSYAGALAYGIDQSEQAMSRAAKGVAALNRVAPDDVTVSLVSSPRAADVKAVSVTIATHRPLVLARLIGTQTELVVASKALAEVGGPEGKPGCILALDPKQTGITLTGAAKVDGPGCIVSSNAGIDISGSTSITAKTTQYATTLRKSGSANIVGPVLKTAAKSDPLAAHAGIVAATARLSAVASMNAPTVPPTTPAGPDIEFAYDQGKTQAAATAAGCTASFASSKWTVTCPNNPSKVYRFGKVTTGGGLSIDFSVGGATTNKYLFTDLVHASGATPIRFGSGSFTFEKGLRAEGDVTFGAGSFAFGAPPAGSTCAYSVCVGGSRKATFAGPSDFKFAAGLDVGGQGVLSLGVGQKNSIKVGAGTGNRAISLQGSGTAFLGSETVDQTAIEIFGDVMTEGSSCLIIGKAAQHDIKGSVSTVGGMIMGAGVYTIGGYFGAGDRAGGEGNCAGKPISIGGTDVSIVLGGSQRMTGGSCSGEIFCVAAGYRNVSIKAPTTGPLAGLAVIGPRTPGTTGGAAFTNGASGAAFSGLIYFPQGPIMLSGGAGISGGSNGCLQLIGSRVTLSGGTNAVSECTSLSVGGSGAGRKISLVQ